MDAWAIWTIAAVCLLIVEVLTQMMWALCLSIGALAALGGALAGVDTRWQLVILIVGALVAYVSLLPWFKRRHARLEKRENRTGMDALIGRRAIVSHEIRPGELGRARIDGDNWQVRAPGVDRVVRPGETVVVTAYDSIILTVELTNK